MSSDLGHLFATLDIKDDAFKSKISGAKTDLVDLKRTADTAGKTSLDVTPKGSDQLDKATGTTRELGDAKKQADGQKLDVTPTGTGSVTAAANEARSLDGNLQKAGQSGESLSVSAQPAQELDKASSAAGGLVDKLGEVASKAAGKAIKWGAITAGTAAIGGMGVALTKGFSRLDSIDQANAKLQGLGHSAQDIEAIMASAMDSVTGTAYGFGDAASLAAQMVASGIEPGEELTGVLTTVADTAAIAGRDLNDMGLIFGSVAAKGKLQGDDLMQLMAGGIPVLQMLSDELGKTTEEVSEMASSGEIDFATFESAMRNSLGGAAQDAGDTVKGAMDNAGAAVGRFGAELLKPAFEAAPGVIGNITSKIDELTESAGPVGEKLAAGLSDFAQGAIPQVQGALTTLKDTGEAVWPVLQKIGEVATSIPMEAYVGLIGMAVAKHKGLTAALSAGGGKLTGWGRAVKDTQSALQAQGREIGVVSSAMLTMQQRIPAVGRMGAAYRESSTDLRLAGMASRETARQMTGLQRVTGRARGSMQSFGGVLAGTVHSGFSLATSGAKGLLNALGGPWGVGIGLATTAISGLIQKHQEAAAEVAAHKQMQDELRESLNQTTGAIGEQTEKIQLKNFEERNEGNTEAALEMGIAEPTLGKAVTGDDNARASASRSVRRYVGDEVAETDFWAKYGDRFEEQGITEKEAGDFARAQQRGEQSGTESTDFYEAGRAAGLTLGGPNREYDDDLKEFTDQLDGVAESANNVSESIGDVNYQQEQMAERIRDGSLDEFARSATQAHDAMGLLTDEIAEGKVRMEDPATIAVEMDAAKADEVKGELEEIGVKSEFKDGELHIEMPEGAGIISLLDEMDVKLKMLPNGTIDLDSNTEEEKQKLIDFGLAVEELDENGDRVGINIDDNFQEKIDELKNLGALSVIDGELQISDNIDVVDGKLYDLDGNLLSSDLRVDDNVDEVDGKMDGIDGRQLAAFVRMDDNTDAIIHNLSLVEIEAETDKHGNVIITDTTDENIERLEAMGANVAEDKHGNVIITDNASEVATNVKNTLNSPNGDTSSRHTVRREFIDASLTPGGSMTRFADENFGGRASGGRIPRNAQGSRIPRSANGDRHAGYRLPTSGPGTGVTDGILGMNPQGIPVSWVDAGEWIINGDSSEEWDGTLAAINGGRPSQIVAAMLADLEAHANGGRTSDRVKSELSPYNGTPYVFGGWGPGGTDCSGAVSMGVNSYLGRDPLESRTGTGNMEAWLSERGFQQGRGGPNDVVVGWLNGGPGGGHTAMQLDDGTFIESGGNTGGGLTIGGPAGPLDGRGFTNFMFLPGDGGEAEGGYDERGSYSAYSSTAGGSSGGGGSSVSKSVNGGAGPLLKDGSVLEAAAAAYSQQTGQPMPDDVVSWGNVLGLGTTFEGENLETEQRRHEREMRAHDRNIAATERDLEQAKKDVGEKEKALAEAKPEDKEQAQWELDDARDKVADLSDKLIDMRDETVELRKTNEQLKVAVEKQKAAPQSAGQAFGITAMADGGILGAARDAQINEGSATLWAEAGPEAYIPLSRNKRARSLDLWAETGKRLGVDVLSMANLVGSGLPGLMEGKLQFSSGDTTSLDRLGLNMDAAKVAGGREIGSAVGAVFNGPVTVNDPRQYLQGQLNTASRQINKAMKSRML